MTFVLQTASGVDPEVDPAIQAVFSRFRVQQQDPPLHFGQDVMHYYDFDEAQNSEALIQELLRLPGVLAAYIKPMGTPPM